MKYQRILTVSDSVMKEFIFGNFFKKKTQIVGNPIELEKIQKKAGEYVIENTYDIAFLGRLAEPKNPLFFIEIMNELHKKKRDLKVAIIGEGELRTEIEKYIIELQLDNVITLYGFVSNPYPILKACKVLCMPSKWEGFGLAAVEALTLGKPVIASPVGGLVDIVNSECGELCDSLSEYVNILEKLLSDRRIYDEKSNNALKREKKLENINEYMKILKDIYNEVLRNGD